MADNTFTVADTDDAERNMAQPQNEATAQNEETPWYERALDRGVDYAAERSLFGAVLAGALNTPGNQAYWDKEKFAKEQRDYDRQQMAESYRNSEIRAAAQNMELESARNNLQQQRIQLEAEKDKAAMKSFDDAVLTKSKALQERLKGNPMWPAMTPDEQKAYIESPQVQADLQALAMLGIAQTSFSGGNQAAEAADLANRILRKTGYKQEISPDGKTYTIITPGGRRMEVTPENIQKELARLSGDAGQAFKTICEVSEAQKSGNAYLMDQADRIRELSRWNGGNMSAAKKTVETVIGNIGGDMIGNEKAKAFYALSSAYKLLKSGNVTPQTSAMILQNAAGAMQKLGIECMDPKNPMGTYFVRSYVGQDGKLQHESLTFDMLGKFAEENDSIGQALDNTIKKAEMSDKTAREMAAKKELARELAEIDAAKQMQLIGARATAKKGGGDGEGEEPEGEMTSVAQRYSAAGSSFFDNKEYSGYADAILDHAKNNPKKAVVTSREQLNIAFGDAWSDAEQKYAKTRSYEEARKAFVDKLHGTYKIPEEFIPPVFDEKMHEQNMQESQREADRLNEEYGKMSGPDFEDFVHPKSSVRMKNRTARGKKKQAAEKWQKNADDARRKLEEFRAQKQSSGRNPAVTDEDMKTFAELLTGHK